LSKQPLQFGADHSGFPSMPKLQFLEHVPKNGKTLSKSDV